MRVFSRAELLENFLRTFQEEDFTTDVAPASKVKEEREDTPTTNVDLTFASNSSTVDPTLADNFTTNDLIPASSSTANNLPRQRILALPEIIVKKLSPGHECQCRDC
ncbi:hypothetical protein JMJ35_002005 [Cladonia borealis]|uniref:Uncharacterized protein n=1 Tax=Cladonia borealis TaxID=184061 RepID=A0AA39R8E7_9LECA|nr:hypothetical protein JMJ35_002005 [Cladonia borealis]